MVKLNDAYELAKYIKDAKKQTPVKVYISGNLKIEKNDKYKVFGQEGSYILIGDYKTIMDDIDTLKSSIVSMLNMIAEILLFLFIISYMQKLELSQVH